MDEVNDFKGDNMALEERCFPPPRWPSELESLTSAIGIIINSFEHGNLEKTLKRSDGFGLHYKKLMHRYDKLFDYIQQGYDERMKTGWSNFITNDAVQLWSHYENVVTRGIIIRGSSRDYLPSLKSGSIKTPEQCFEEYFQPARKAWKRLQRLQPVSKKNISLLRHFNETTHAVGERECDSQTEWDFDEGKDEWKRDYRKDITIFHY